MTDAVTYAACLTPPGAGAIAVLALRGSRAWEIAQAVFQRPGGAPLPAEPEAGRVWFGRAGDEGRGRDEVVLAVGRDGLELHCHGGGEVVRLLLDVLSGQGVAVVPWRDCVARSSADALQVEALDALARAATVRTAAILLDQHAGAFANALDAVLAALDRGEADKAARLLEELDSRVPLGRRLTEPWRVVVAGAPNVGKSSLVNALAGYQRSVVSPVPGTTRDVVTARIAVDGWPVELSDTAGWREGGEALEREGMGLARAAAAGADLCLWVVDAAAPPAWPNVPLEPVQVVVNKSDLPAAWDLKTAAGAVCVSALTGSGLGELCAALSRRLVPEPPATGAAVPFTPALCDAIAEALRACRDGRSTEAAAALRPLVGP